MTVTVLGGAATLVAARRGEPLAIWGTMGYFTAMELLQSLSYPVMGQCGNAANWWLAYLSYLHIAFQPIVINAFCMAIAPRPVAPGMRRLVYVLATIATFTLLARSVPMDWAGPCRDGEALCGPDFCVLPGQWHLAWNFAMNDLWAPLRNLLNYPIQFPDYMAAAFVLPLAYGAWRFVLFHLLAGPALASALTSNPDEMPAIWCLLSIGIILIGISPAFRSKVFAARIATA